MAASAAVVGGQMIGAYMQGESAKSAAQQQQQAAAAAQATQQQALQQQLSATEPWRQAGTQALGQLSQGLQTGGQFATPFTLDMAKLSPAQQAVQQQSLEAMRNQMQLGGQNLSTNAITGAGTLAGNLAGQFEQQAFNQWIQQQQQQMGGLEQIAGLGSGATGAATSAMGTAAQNIGSLQMGAGNAAAAGTVAGGNALAQAIGGGVTGAAQMYQLNQLLSPTSPTTPSAGVGSAGGPWAPGATADPFAAPATPQQYQFGPLR